MKLSDFNILYINLDKNKDRRKHIENEFKRLKLKKVTRIEGIDGQKLSKFDKDFFLNKKSFKTMCSIPERVLGRAGCYLSHLKALDYAIENKFENVLIMEDDAVFLLNEDVELPEYPDNPDMLYLGGTFWKQEPEETKQTGLWCHINRKHLKMAGCFGFILPTKNKIKMCREIFKWVKPSAIDNLYINYIQSLGHSYFINPVLISHNNDFESNIKYSKGMLKNKHYYT